MVQQIGRRAALAGMGVAVTCATGALATGARAQAVRRRVSFATMAAGATPTDFSLALTGSGKPPVWVVAADTTLPAPNLVLAQTSQDRTENHFPLAILDGYSAPDVLVLTRFRTVDGSVDQAGGVIARVQDARNYYVARANALEGNVTLYVVTNGVRRQIGGQDVPVAKAQWHSLALRVEGRDLQVSFNDRPLFNVTDRTIAKAGRVGLWTKSDSVTHFEFLQVDTLP